jgi:hypothetical protein
MQNDASGRLKNRAMKWSLRSMCLPRQIIIIIIIIMQSVGAWWEITPRNFIQPPNQVFLKRANNPTQSHLKYLQIFITFKFKRVVF